MKQLTKKQKKDYLENPDACPSCKSKEVEFTDKWEDVLCIYEEWMCHECKSWWIETYKLAEVELSGEVY